MMTFVSDAENEVAQLVSELIQIDTTNFGTQDGPGEAEAAEYCQGRLQEVGIDSERIETSAPHRQALVARIEGADPSRPALLLHGHLDVVPALEEGWKHPPFSGEIDDEGILWGRGAVDMKDMDGMMLAIIRDWARSGVKPDRDIVLLYLPDEEAGGRHGGRWLKDNRPDIFEGVTEAVGEVGGFSVEIAGASNGARIYPIQTAEKGIAWLTLSADGKPGHGSFLNPDNAALKLARALTRIGDHEFEVTLTPAAQQFVDGVAELAGVQLDLNDPEDVIAKLGGIGRVINSTVRHTANITMLSASPKANVVHPTAQATLDGRFLPGLEDDFLKQIDALLGKDVRREHLIQDIAVETTFDGATVEAMGDALRSQDPDAVTLPYLMSGGTDAKSFSELGIRCYGFSPLRLPGDLDFFGMFHAVNERVPVDALKFGVRVLDNFLRRV